MWVVLWGEYMRISKRKKKKLFFPACLPLHFSNNFIYQRYCCHLHFCYHLLLTSEPIFFYFRSGLNFTVTLQHSFRSSEPDWECWSILIMHRPVSGVSVSPVWKEPLLDYLDYIMKINLIHFTNIFILWELCYSSDVDYWSLSFIFLTQIFILYPRIAWIIVFLPQAPKFWDYRHVPPHLA